MGSDADGVVGRIKDKAKAAVHGLTGENESRGDADPDIEYEEAPDQHILHDGMVVLSADQVEENGGGDESAASSDAAPADESGGTGAEGDAGASTG